MTFFTFATFVRSCTVKIAPTCRFVNARDNSILANSVVLSNPGKCTVDTDKCMTILLLTSIVATTYIVK